MQASARLSSSAGFRKVIAGVSSATTRSCYRTSRGKAHAAPLPAQEPPTKGRKRITNKERKARMVEFIENYRASNEGKFPTITNIRGQIGGGHYTVRKVLQEMEYNHAKSLKPAPLQVTVEATKRSLPEDEGKVAQFSEHSRHKDDSGKAAKHDMDTPETCKTAEAPTLSDQTESESFKDLTDEPDPGNLQMEIEANKFDLKNYEKSVDTNDSNASDQSGSDMANEAKTHAREENQKLEESVNMGLLGSLRSFAYGIRNFWKNM